MLSFNFIFYSLYISFKCLFILERQSPTYCFVHVLFSDSSNAKCLFCVTSSASPLYILLSNVNQRQGNRKRRNRKSRLEIIHIPCVSSADFRRVRLLLSINNDNFCKMLCPKRGKRKKTAA